ncbi:MAG: hypothetical protein HC934_03485 [Acaryochloridaceae cyanobacterium SU_2_1]|nr:hypothetical protein [Acaryochloridaceae cyanobacterium SU_2_1]NJM95070.1 hypothetical protein [Acaryochloridaceae cyanobacterium CSU_5_19]
MNAFDPTPPPWSAAATHARQFCCPSCQATCFTATDVWINRRAPVMTEEHQRKWQEFYACPCGQAWWAWSSDRPPSPIQVREDLP